MISESTESAIGSADSDQSVDDRLRAGGLTMRVQRAFTTCFTTVFLLVLQWSQYCCLEAAFAWRLLLRVLCLLESFACWSRFPGGLDVDRILNFVE